MQLNCIVDKNSDAGRYLIACARIRDVTVTKLMRDVVEAIARDQLVSAVLDDEGCRRHVKFAKRFREIA